MKDEDIERTEKTDVSSGAAVCYAASAPEWLMDTMADHGYIDIPAPWTHIMFAKELSIECMIITGENNDCTVRLYATDSRFKAKFLVYHHRIVRSSKDVEFFIRDIEKELAV